MHDSGPKRWLSALIARAPEGADAPVEGRWPRAAGLLLAVGLSAGLWALLIWGVFLLLR